MHAVREKRPTVSQTCQVSKESEHLQMILNSPSSNVHTDITFEGSIVYPAISQYRSEAFIHSVNVTISKHQPYLRMHPLANKETSNSNIKETFIFYSVDCIIIIE